MFNSGSKKEVPDEIGKTYDDKLASTKLWAIFIDSIWTSIFI